MTSKANDAIVSTPAAATTRPITAIVGSDFEIGSLRRANARNRVRNPVKARSAATARSPSTTRGPMLQRRRAPSPASDDSRAPTSPSLESTRLGRASARPVPTAKTTKARRSDHSGPVRRIRPAPRGVASVTAAIPPSSTRELAVTRLSPRGWTRGIAAARVTPYALLAIRWPKAAGYSAKASCPPATAPAITHARNAREISVSARA